MILLVMLCQALVYKEVTALFDLRDRECQDRRHTVSALTKVINRWWRSAGRGRPGQG
jgi:predicted kinase